MGENEEAAKQGKEMQSLKNAAVRRESQQGHGMVYGSEESNRRIARIRQSRERSVKEAQDGKLAGAEIQPAQDGKLTKIQPAQKVHSEKPVESQNITQREVVKQSHMMAEKQPKKRLRMSLAESEREAEGGNGETGKRRAVSYTGKLPTEELRRARRETAASASYVTLHGRPEEERKDSSGMAGPLVLPSGSDTPRKREEETVPKVRKEMRLSEETVPKRHKETAPSEDAASKRHKETVSPEKAAPKRRTEVSSSEETATGNWQERLRERRRRRIRNVLFAFGGVIGIAYLAVAVYFGSHFYEGTGIFGIDCSQKTVEEVKEEVSEKLGEYRLALKEREGRTEYLSAEQVGLRFVDNSSIDQMMRAQRSYIWPVMILLDKNQMASVAFTYDKEKTAGALGQLACMNAAYSVAPKDAYVKTTDTGFVVEPEVMGTMLDPKKTQEALFAALDSGSTELSLEEEECYIDPKVYRDDEELQRIASQKNELAKANITFDFGDRQEVVNASVIEDWIVERADGSFVIDDVCVTEYVESLAQKYDTFGMPRDFYTSIGTVVTLYDGDYGWCIDQDATIVALLNALAEGYQGTMEPVYLYTAMSRDTNDIGDTYVEICISRQEMWCYEYGTCIVDTPVVTGNPNKNNATPSNGVWSIDAKMRDYVLVGEGYRSPVDYWMPFNGGVGIHDMQTRAYFGGSIYLTNGSHGCINTPYNMVQVIYNAVSVGTPVIVYD